MRRSLAPSVLKPNGVGSSSNVSSRGSESRVSSNNEDGTVTIQRMPLFGFLSIPDELKRQFKVPAGCVITEQSVALRKVKTLGGRKIFNSLRPSGEFIPKRLSPVMAPSVDEDNDRDAAPLDAPPFEPLILWTDPADSSHRIEVSGSPIIRLLTARDDSRLIGHSISCL
jgi:hypothetical protein